MKNKFFLLVILLTFFQSAFPQKAETENHRKAYLFSSGDQRIEPVSPKKAYLFSSGVVDGSITRPRVVKTVERKSAEDAVVSADKNSSLERQAFDLINQQRAKLNLELLTWSDDVANIARIHSQNMANFNFFSHSDLNGLMVNDRADVCGVKKWQAIGENIAYNRGYNNPVEFAVERWMQSVSHRENLLNSRWKESGIGIAVTKDGTYYFTEVFLVRK